MATNRHGKYTCMSSYCLYSCLTSTLERQKWHIAIVVLQAMSLHGVAVHIARILMDYMENVAEALAHVHTMWIPGAPFRFC